VKIGDTILEAAVDTAAEVTIILEEVFQTLEPRPQVLRETTMHAAGRGMVMKTLVVGPVSLQIGYKSYETEVYVAPIKDEMLLGLNFMVEFGVVVNLRDRTFKIGDEDLSLSSGPKGIIPVVSKVRVKRRTVVPPFSVVHVSAQLDGQIGQYVIEPNEQNLPILMPRCLYQNENPVVCLVNLSDRYYTIKRDTVAGTAESIQPMSESVVEATCVTETKGELEGEVPEQLAELINHLSSDLTVKEKGQMESLLLVPYRRSRRGL
jgi:predicted aspartyl protease